jgi:mRNA interferase RelE/StbE
VRPADPYQVRIKRPAEREMDSLPRAVFARVSQAILSLGEAPRHMGVKKLRSREAYRLRVGSYRVVCTVDDSARAVEVIAVGHRREVYRDL